MGLCPTPPPVDSAWRSLDSTHDTDFGGPAIICQTFAIELLLKFFIVAEHADAADETVFARLGLDLRGHRCVTLYERLSADSCSTLEAAFATRRSSTMPTSLRDALVALGDDLFFKWRYVYEGSGPLAMDKALLDCVTDTLGACAALSRHRLEGMRTS